MVSEVHLVFTVTDEQGRYIRDLKQDDFTVLDDRKPPKEILSFHSETSYAPHQITQVAEAFASIQEELRSQYSVSYKPEAFKLDDHYRTIEVHAHTRKGLRIRSRKGYRPRERDYAPTGDLTH